MKRPSPLWFSGVLLTATGLALLLNPTAEPATRGEKPDPSTTAVPAREGLEKAARRSAPLDEFLAPQGHLWEPHASTPREARRTSVPLRRQAFAALRDTRPGARIRLDLSDRIPALDATLSHDAVQADGTRVSHLRIDGDPTGELIVQENEAAGFFLAQLYYQDDPVAYEFRRSGEGLVARRHPVSDLICSMIGNDGDLLAMGLPKPEIAEGRGGNGNGNGGGNGGGGGGGRTVSISDASVLEGTGGSNALTFTLTLSSSDKKNAIRVDYTTSDGSAVAPDDYSATSGTVVFPKRTTQQTITVPIVPDAVAESDETFTIALNNPSGATLGTASATGTVIDDDLAPANVPLHESLPGATAVAYLDMDGETVSGTPWNGGNPIVAGGIAGSFSSAAMTDIWKRVAEDFLPFEINVTTDESAYLAAPADRRIRCIITPDSAWYGSAGGVAYLDSFTWTGDTPCWVFSNMLSNSGSFIAEACSHEIGHTLGLRHDGRTNPSEAYYQGHGSGETGWAPIMGVGYYRYLTQWSKGEYLNADNPEDDLAIITGQNGFGYRADDHADSSGAATPLDRNGLIVSGSGIVGQPGDVDVFRFTVTGGGQVGILVLPGYPSWNLDLEAEIRDANGNLLASDNHPDIVRANPVATLPAAGTYYLHVKATGKGDPQNGGYTDYGSLGAYTVEGQTP